MQAKKVKAGDTISVYWPEDRVWYEGEVLSTHDTSGTCEVLYEDGEREVLTLTKEKYKIIEGGKKGVLEKVLENDGNISKQLAAIAAVLYDMEDRLPARGVCSSRLGWWSAWHYNAESAVEIGNVILLARSTYELANQLRPSITTPWWNDKSAEWRDLLRRVKTCAELLHCVTTLLTRGVDWTCARQLFPRINGHSDGGSSQAVGWKKSQGPQARKKGRGPGSADKDQVKTVKASSVNKAVDVKNQNVGRRDRLTRAKKIVEEETEQMLARLKHLSMDLEFSAAGSQQDTRGGKRGVNEEVHIEDEKFLSTQLRIFVEQEKDLERGPSSNERASTKPQDLKQLTRHAQQMNSVVSGTETFRKDGNPSRSTRLRANLNQENIREKDSSSKKETQVHRGRYGTRIPAGTAGKAAQSEYSKGAEDFIQSSRLRKNVRQEKSDNASWKEDSDKDSILQEDVLEEPTRKLRRRRGAMQVRESQSDDDSAAPSNRPRRDTKQKNNYMQKKIPNQLRTNRKEEVSDEEDESGDDESIEEESSEEAVSSSSGGSEDEEYKLQKSRSSMGEQFPRTTRRSKRKSDEHDHGSGKKSRRDVMQTRLREAVSRNSLSRLGGSRRTSRKEDSDDDFVMESNEEGASLSSEESQGSEEVSGHTSDQEEVEDKLQAREKSVKLGLERTDLADGEDLSDEEVCSVCKVLCAHYKRSSRLLLVRGETAPRARGPPVTKNEFAGAADMMLLCDGENCEEAIHSFCLKIPLQSIPEGDWLCPLCMEESKAPWTSVTKRTSRMRAKLIPPLKKVEVIVGWRGDVSATETGTSRNRRLQYLVKWSSMSHRHDTWVPEDWLIFFDRGRLSNYQRKSFAGDGDEQLADERRPEWLQIDRIIACRDPETHNEILPQDLRKRTKEPQCSSEIGMEYLVKWTNIEYNGSTWEKGNDDKDMQESIQKFLERHLQAEERACAEPTERTVATTIKKQPDYIHGGVLHGYQLQGLKWLLTNFEQYKSVILADEMGLGKTIQAVSFMMCLKHEKLSSKPVLVIGPKSTLVGWEQELRQWGSDLNSVIYQGEKDSRALLRNYEFYTKEKMPLFDVLVTSYDLAMMDNFLFQKFHWSCIIVDEGHRVKNMRSKLGILLKRHTADFRLLLTGTPVQNTLTELFALLHFLDPSEFADPEKSALEFAQVDILGGGGYQDGGGMEQQVARIHELLRPRMLRRLKAEVMQNMIPGKKYVEVLCALTPLQRHQYAAILKKNHKQLNRGNTTGKKRSLSYILMDLKMVCNHPYLFPGQEPDHHDTDDNFKFLVNASGKLQLLEKLLPKLKEGGHRVLLFSQMTKMLDILEDFLNYLDYKFCRIDGSTVASERQKLIGEFNSLNSEHFIFLISTRAGGLGINLPSADTVIIYDPDFNPFVDLQAQARAHRIGQEKVVLVYQLVTKCSVEEKILQRSRQKLAMENLVMSSNDRETAQDVNTLLLHGARKVLQEHNVEATSVKWTDENLAKLLNRDILNNKDLKEEGDGYLGAVQEPEVVLAGQVENKPNVKTGCEWEELLGKLVEAELEADEGKLGRGKRQRKKILYTFEPNIDAHEDEDEHPEPGEDDFTCSGGSSISSGSDVSLDEERGSRALNRLKSKSLKLEEEASVLIAQGNLPNNIAVNSSEIVPPQGAVQIPPLFSPTVPQFPSHFHNLAKIAKETPLPGQLILTQSAIPGQLFLQSATPHITSSVELATNISSHTPSPTLFNTGISVRPVWNQFSTHFSTSIGVPNIKVRSPSPTPSPSQIPSPLRQVAFSPNISLPGAPAISQAPWLPQPPPLSDPIEPLRTSLAQMFSSSISSELASATYKLPNGLPLNNMDVKFNQTPNLHPHDGILSLEPVMRSAEVDRSPLYRPVVAGSSDMTVKYGSEAAFLTIPVSYTFPYTDDGAASETNPPEDSIADRATLQEAVRYHLPVQSESMEFLTLEEVLRRTGTKTSGKLERPFSAVWSQGFTEAKRASPEKVVLEKHEGGPSVLSVKIESVEGFNVGSAGSTGAPATNDR